MLELGTKNLRKNGAETILYLYLSGALTVSLGYPWLTGDSSVWLAPKCSFLPSYIEYLTSTYSVPGPGQVLGPLWQIKQSLSPPRARVLGESMNKETDTRFVE